jgi:hypothetical protein
MNTLHDKFFYPEYFACGGEITNAETEIFFRVDPLAPPRREFGIFNLGFGVGKAKR